MDKMENIKRIISRVSFILFILLAGVTAITFAGSLEPEAILKAYKSGVKTCKKIEREYENMRCQHEIMFKSWKEKSLPLLIEDKELITKCNETIHSRKYQKK